MPDAPLVHARYGPPDRYHPAPAAGMCLSVFALVRAPGGKTLVGKPADSLQWMRWAPSWQHYSDDELAATFAGWLFPATYLLEGEDPRAGLDRVMRGMLGARSYRVADRPRVFSALAPSDWYPGHQHWDLAFVFDVSRAKLPKTAPSLWRELAWKAPRDLKAAEFSWNEDLARWLKVAR
jgi:hypothetical protein